MTHRTIKIDGTLFDIFDTQLGFDHFKKRSEGGDISIVLRNKALFMRRGEVELTVRPEAGTTNDDRQKAARAILDEAEAMIRLEMAADGPAMGPTDFPTISLKPQAASIDG